MLVRAVTGYERRQQDKAIKTRVRQELSKPPTSVDAAKLEIDLAEIQTGSRPVVRRDCAFCGRECSPADDNHAEDCPYWTIGPGRSDLG